MKTKSFEISAADLNTGDVQVIETTITRSANVAAEGYSIQKTMYPRGLQVVNSTGVDIGYVIVASEDEDTEFQAELANPGSFPFYDFILLAKDSTLSESNLVQCYKFYVKKLSGTASGPLRLDFKQYG